MEKTFSYKQKISRVLFSVFMVIALSFAVLSVALPAYGAGFGESRYANYLMTENDGNRGGWDYNVIEDSVQEQIAMENAQATQTAFVGKWDNISTTVGYVMGFLAVTVAVLRFVGRGVYEMAFRRDSKQKQDITHSLLFTFIATGEERRKGSNEMSTEWFMPMLRETLITFLIVFGIWVFFNVLASIVLFVLTSGVEQTTQDAGFGDITQFGVHGLD